MSKDNAKNKDMFFVAATAIVLMFLVVAFVLSFFGKDNSAPNSQKPKGQEAVSQTTIKDEEEDFDMREESTSETVTTRENVSVEKSTTISTTRPTTTATNVTPNITTVPPSIITKPATTLPVNNGPQTSGEVHGSSIELPNNNEFYGVFYCKRLGIMADLYYGDSAYCLHYGVGQSISSLFPGFGRPTLISGHNSTFFSPLKSAQVGDVFELDITWGYYKYEIYNIEILDADPNSENSFDFNVLNQKSDDLIVYTCYPFLGQTESTERIFFYCKKVSGPVVVM